MFPGSDVTERRSTLATAAAGEICIDVYLVLDVLQTLSMYMNNNIYPVNVKYVKV